MPARPTLPSAQVQAVVDRLLRVADLLERQLAEVVAPHGLTVAQALLLRSLDGPVPMHRVAAVLGCDPSNVTGLVARIERLGLVRRTPDPDDGRVRLLSLTDRGRQLRTRLSKEVADAAAASWPLGRAELAHLADLLADLSLATPDLADDRAAGVAQPADPLSASRPAGGRRRTPPARRQRPAG